MIQEPIIMNFRNRWLHQIVKAVNVIVWTISATNVGLRGHFLLSERKNAQNCFTL